MLLALTVTRLFCIYPARACLGLLCLFEFEDGSRCREVFVCPNKWEEHFAGHLQLGLYSCAGCKISFATLLGARQHLKMCDNDGSKLVVKRSVLLEHATEQKLEKLLMAKKESISEAVRQGFEEGLSRNERRKDDCRGSGRTRNRNRKRQTEYFESRVHDIEEEGEVKRRRTKSSAGTAEFCSRGRTPSRFDEERLSTKQTRRSPARSASRGRERTPCRIDNEDEEFKLSKQGERSRAEAVGSRGRSRTPSTLPKVPRQFRSEGKTEFRRGCGFLLEERNIRKGTAVKELERCRCESSAEGTATRLRSKSPAALLRSKSPVAFLEQHRREKSPCGRAARLRSKSPAAFVEQHGREKTPVRGIADRSRGKSPAKGIAERMRKELEVEEKKKAQVNKSLKTNERHKISSDIVARSGVKISRLSRQDRLTETVCKSATEPLSSTTFQRTSVRSSGFGGERASKSGSQPSSGNEHARETISTRWLPQQLLPTRRCAADETDLRKSPAREVIYANPTAATTRRRAMSGQLLTNQVSTFSGVNTSRTDLVDELLDSIYSPIHWNSPKHRNDAPSVAGAPMTRSAHRSSTPEVAGVPKVSLQPKPYGYHVSVKGSKTPTYDSFTSTSQECSYSAMFRSCHENWERQGDSLRNGLAFERRLLTQDQTNMAVFPPKTSLGSNNASFVRPRSRSQPPVSQLSTSYSASNLDSVRPQALSKDAADTVCQWRSQEPCILPGPLHAEVQEVPKNSFGCSQELSNWSEQFPFGGFSSGSHDQHHESEPDKQAAAGDRINTSTNNRNYTVYVNLCNDDDEDFDEDIRVDEVADGDSKLELEYVSSLPVDQPALSRPSLEKEDGEISDDDERGQNEEYGHKRHLNDRKSGCDHSVRRDSHEGRRSHFRRNSASFEVEHSTVSPVKSIFDQCRVSTSANSSPACAGVITSTRKKCLHCDEYIPEAQYDIHVVKKHRRM